MEFGAAEFRIDSKGDIVGNIKYHSFLINPQKIIPREVSDITGIFNHHVDHKPLFSEVAEDIWNCLDGAVLIAHNFNFDFGFLRNEFRRLGKGKEWPNTIAEIDTLKMAQNLLPKLKSKRLGKVSEHLGIPLEQAHRATDDAEACGRVFASLCKRFEAPDTAYQLANWAIGVCRPPENDIIKILDKGMPEFIQGKHKGKLIEEETLYLHWMTLAKIYKNQVWEKRFTDEVINWIKIWLRGRLAGNPTESKYSPSREEWNPDPV